MNYRLQELPTEQLLLDLIRNHLAWGQQRISNSSDSSFSTSERNHRHRTKLKSFQLYSRWLSKRCSNDLGMSRFVRCLIWVGSQLIPWKKDFISFFLWNQKKNSQIRFYVENMNIFTGNGQCVIASSNIRSKSDVMNRISDWIQLIGFCPTSTVCTLKNKNFSTRRLWTVITSSCQHRNMISVHWLIPGQTTQRQFTWNFMLNCPLWQIHYVRSFINSYNSITGTCC